MLYRRLIEASYAVLAGTLYSLTYSSRGAEIDSSFFLRKDTDLGTHLYSIAAVPYKTTALLIMLCCGEPVL